MRNAVVALCLVATACGGSEPKVTTVAFDGRPSAVTIAQGKVWVADDGGHTVQVFHREGEAAYRPVRVERNPIALASNGNDLWVAHASGHLSRIDMRTREVTVEHTDPEASFTSVAVMRGEIYATDVDRGVWDVVRGRWIHLEQGAVRAVTHDASLWVSGRENSVARVDPRSLDDRTYEVGFGPIGLAVLDDGLWVANSDDDSVQRVGQQRFVPVGKGPVALTALDGLLFVANQDGRSVSVVNPAERSVERTISVDTDARGIAAGLGAVWVVGTNPETLVRVEP